MQTDILKLTYDDYRQMPDDGRRHEIIDGDEYMAPAPNTFHQGFVVNLSYALQTYALDTGRGRVLIALTDVILSDVDIVQPDVLFVREERLHIIERRGVFGAPDLVVEVLSEGNRRHDEVRKRRLYERFRVAEYGIADPELETLKVYRFPDETAERYERVAELANEHGDVYTSPLLPGLEVPLERLSA